MNVEEGGGLGGMDAVLCSRKIFWAYLDHDSLLAAGCVSRAWNSALSEDSASIWRALVGRDFYPWRSDEAGATDDDEHSATKYMENVAGHRARLRLVDAAIRHRASDGRISDKQALAACLFDMIHLRILVPSIGLGLLSLSVLIALSLDRIVHWPVWWVCAPLWILFTIIAVASIMTLVAKRRYDDRTSVWHRLVRHDGGQDSSFLVWVLVALGKSKTAAGSAAIAMVSALGFLLLVAINASKPRKEQTPWEWVFVPLWACFLIACCVPCIHRQKVDLRGYTPGFVVSMVFMWVPSFTVAVMVLVRLSETRNLTTSVVLIPFWIIGGLMLCLPLVGVATAYRRARHLRNDLNQAIWSLVLVYCVVFPWVLFEILLSVYDEFPEKLSARAVFSPLMAWLSVFAIILIVYGVNVKFIGPGELLPT